MGNQIMNADTKDPFAAFGAGQGGIKPEATTRLGGSAGGMTGTSLNSEKGNVTAFGASNSKDAPLAMDALMTASLNPLVAVALPLLIAAPRVRGTARHPNPTGLKEALAEGITKFESQARAQGLPNEQVIAARYILCTFLDESAASTPWGGSGTWSAHSLLVQFHNETWGGEKVFQLLSKLAENVPGNRNLLELMYVVLAFGFEGRYRVIDNGTAQLEEVRKRLVQMIQQGQPKPERTLSPRWRGIESQATKLRDAVPLWVIASISALLLACIYLALRFSLGNVTEPTVQSLRQLEVKPPAEVPKEAVKEATKARLATWLEPEIKAGQLVVNDYADRSVVVIKSDGFFEPGKAQVAPKVLSLLHRIGEAVNQLPGALVVTGHTDNRPIRSSLFPSNLALSQKRAEAVQGELAKTVLPSRMRAEGRSDSEPVADNATAEGRAKNRRVEITLNLPQETK